MSWGEIKKAINSTLGTSISKSLDEWLKYRGGDFAFEYESAGTFSLTVPSWATIAIVTACGGGGGGAYAGYEDHGDYGETVPGIGGAGGTAIYNKIYSVTPNSTLSITVGKGGTGGRLVSSGTTAAQKGGSTQIGTLVTLVGGNGASTSSTGTGSGGAGKNGLSGGAYGSNSYYGGGSLGIGGAQDDIGHTMVYPTRGGGGGASRYRSNGYSTGDDGAPGYVKIIFK